MTHTHHCSFQVLKYFKNEVAKLNIKQDETSELIQLLREILYSHDEEIKSMDKDTTGFVNSLSVLYNTMMTTGIVAEINGNFTNNKVESHNEKIKQYISRNVHLPEALRNLLNSIMDSYNSSAYSKFLNMKTRIDTSFKHDTRNKYALFCVQPAFDIRSELNKMESIKHNVVKADDNIIVTLVSDNRKHVVDNSFSNCSCSVWGNYGLPCRHIFVCRKNESKNLYDETLVDAMWRKDLALNDCVRSESVLYSPVRTQLKTKRKIQSKISSVDEYLKAYEFFKEMASFLSTCGEADFFYKFEYLKLLKETWMLNENVP